MTATIRAAGFDSGVASVARLFGALLLLAGALMARPALAADARGGLWLTTDYPAMAVRAGETTTVKVKLQNSGLAPQRVALSVGGVPQGWKATVLGGGVPVAAAMPATNDSVQLQLRLEVPANAPKGTQRVVDRKSTRLNSSHT